MRRGVFGRIGLFVAAVAAGGGSALAADLTCEAGAAGRGAGPSAGRSRWAGCYVGSTGGAAAVGAIRSI